MCFFEEKYVKLGCKVLISICFYVDGITSKYHLKEYSTYLWQLQYLAPSTVTLSTTFYLDGPKLS
jgi:hypothetical protein